MQRVYFSPGKALCRFCGELISTNSLSTHIAAVHRRPSRADLAPQLVRRTPVRAGLPPARRTRG